MNRYGANPLSSLASGLSRLQPRDPLSNLVSGMNGLWPVKHDPLKSLYMSSGLYSGGGSIMGLLDRYYRGMRNYPGFGSFFRLPGRWGGPYGGWIPGSMAGGGGRIPSPIARGMYATAGIADATRDLTPQEINNYFDYKDRLSRQRLDWRKAEREANKEVKEKDDKEADEKKGGGAGGAKGAGYGEDAQEASVEEPTADDIREKGYKRDVAKFIYDDVFENLDDADGQRFLRGLPKVSGDKKNNALSLGGWYLEAKGVEDATKKDELLKRAIYEKGKVDDPTQPVTLNDGKWYSKSEKGSHLHKNSKKNDKYMWEVKDNFATPYVKEGGEWVQKQHDDMIPNYDPMRMLKKLKELIEKPNTGGVSVTPPTRSQTSSQDLARESAPPATGSVGGNERNNQNSGGGSAMAGAVASNSNVDRMFNGAGELYKPFSTMSLSKLEPESPRLGKSQMKLGNYTDLADLKEIKSGDTDEKQKSDDEGGKKQGGEYKTKIKSGVGGGLNKTEKLLRRYSHLIPSDEAKEFLKNDSVDNYGKTFNECTRRKEQYDKALKEYWDQNTKGLSGVEPYYEQKILKFHFDKLVLKDAKEILDKKIAEIKDKNNGVKLASRDVPSVGRSAPKTDKFGIGAKIKDLEKRFVTIPDSISMSTYKKLKDLISSARSIKFPDDILKRPYSQREQLIALRERKGELIKKITDKKKKVVDKLAVVNREKRREKFRLDLVLPKNSRKTGDITLGKTVFQRENEIRSYSNEKRKKHAFIRLKSDVTEEQVENILGLASKPGGLEDAWFRVVYKDKSHTYNTLFECGEGEAAGHVDALNYAADYLRDDPSNEVLDISFIHKHELPKKDEIKNIFEPISLDDIKIAMDGIRDWRKDHKYKGNIDYRVITPYGVFTFKCSDDCAGWSDEEFKMYLDEIQKKYADFCEGGKMNGTHNDYAKALNYGDKVTCTFRYFYLDMEKVIRTYINYSSELSNFTAYLDKNSVTLENLNEKEEVVSDEVKDKAAVLNKMLTNFKDIIEDARIAGTGHELLDILLVYVDKEHKVANEFHIVSSNSGTIVSQASPKK